MKTVLKLGTRRSLLAWAQSSWVAREIEKANPGLKIELVGIETRGDRILDVPLSQVQGKEFFVAEVDNALLSGEVDLTVHSMKDLSLDRPKGIRLAASPRRENPRDAIVFAPGILASLREGKVIRIGTSSPRRLENLPAFVERALPRVSTKSSDERPQIEFVEIRGNVNTRLSRVHEPVGSEKHLDGVVLAFAGLNRLWLDPNGKGKIELEKLLTGARWMVMPLRENPTAPAQGALEIECRSDDHATFDAIHKIHDEETFRQITVERQLLADWGGGCHQRFGATAFKHPLAGDLFFVRGAKPDGTFVDELRWRAPSRDKGPALAWDGAAEREGAFETKRLGVDVDLDEGAVFVAHSRAAEELKFGPNARIWTSGVASWFRLAARGLWVEGCAENLGFEAVKPTLGAEVLRLPLMRDWTVLTHEEGAAGWAEGRVIATYRTRANFDKSVGEKLRAATHAYWSSGSQFDALHSFAASGVHHACGPGKTVEHLREAGLSVTVFPSVEEWRKWIKG